MIQAAQEVRARGVEQVIVVQHSASARRIDQTQSLLRSVTHRDSRSVIQRDDGRRSNPHQFLVERNDLPPISFIRGLRFRMNGRDGSLNLIAADAPNPQRPFHQSNTFFNLPAIPTRAILFVERDELTAIVYASLA